MFSKSLLAIGVLGAALASLSAQDAKPEIKIDRVDLKVEQQMTPQIQAIGITEHRWKPKAWLELLVDFKAKIANTLGGREGVYPSIEIKYYVALNGAKTKDGKQVVLSGSITYQNVPNDEVHALAYVTPATLKRLLMKDNGGKADVGPTGIEILAGGTVIAGKTSTGTKWWEAADKISFEEAILSKDKTPFAPFWGDFDLAVGK